MKSAGMRVELAGTKMWIEIGEIFKLKNDLLVKPLPGENNLSLLSTFTFSEWSVVIESFSSILQDRAEHDIFGMRTMLLNAH